MNHNQVISARTGIMKKKFTQFATAVAQGAGKPLAFISAFLLVLVWAILGPIFGFSETWQLVINTGTTIITFLMVFVLQNSQNRDSAAIQSKLDDLILTSRAHNTFIGAEKLDDEELEKLRMMLQTCRDDPESTENIKLQNVGAEKIQLPSAGL